MGPRRAAGRYKPAGPVIVAARRAAVKRGRRPEGAYNITQESAQRAALAVVARLIKAGRGS